MAIFVNPVEEDQGGSKEINDSQIIQMILQPGEDNENVANVTNQETSRADKLKSLSIVNSLLDLSTEKNLNLYGRLNRV